MSSDDGSLPVHPGALLEEELRTRKVSSVPSLARNLRLHPERLSRVLNGESSMNADLAVRLGRLWDMSPRFWMNLQVEYDLAVAKQRLGSFGTSANAATTSRKP